MAMFPLGSVLFPHLPLHLQVFEERYLVMLSQLVEARDVRFGVVLIERGFEVGGGEHRFRTGTVAEVVRLGADGGVVALAAQGAARFEVTDWLDDAPYPRAAVRELPELVWDPGLADLRAGTERVVRRALAQASEFGVAGGLGGAGWDPDVELSDDPLESCWQLAGIAPVGELDQLTLLRAGSVETLLTDTRRLTEEAALGFSAPWPDPGGDG